MSQKDCNSHSFHKQDYINNQIPVPKSHVINIKSNANGELNANHEAVTMRID